MVAELSALLDEFLLEQLAGKPDPMSVVVADGLPAVRRLELLISGRSDEDPAPATTGAPGGAV